MLNFGTWKTDNIQGSYGRLPRILFYVTLLFALIAKAHEWLIAGALVAALTYSGVAAIHACLLVWRGPGWGELDRQALIAILSASCIITVPLLNWSRTLRHLGVQGTSNGTRETPKDQPTRTIIVYWGCLVTVGFLCLFVSLWNFDLPISQVTFSGIETIACTPKGDLNLTVGQNPKWGNLVPNYEFITENNCTDPCHNVEPLDGQSAIFRSADDLQVLTMEQVNLYYDVDLKGGRGKTLKFVQGYRKYGLLFLPYILLQGIWTACFGRRNPIQVRDKVYLLLSQQRFLTIGRAEEWKKWGSKYYALMIYAWAVFIFVICPPLFIINLVANELEIYLLPQQESSKHVGAWSPWAATVLVLLAALVARFHNSGVKLLKKIVSYEIKHFPHAIQRRKVALLESDTEKGVPPRPRFNVTRPNEMDRKKSIAPFTDVKKDMETSAWRIFKKAMTRQWGRYHAVCRIVQENWEETHFFLSNPDDQAHDTDRHGNTINSHGDYKGIGVDRDHHISINRTETNHYTRHTSSRQNHVHPLPAVHHSQSREPSSPTASRYPRYLLDSNTEYLMKSSHGSTTKPTSAHTPAWQSSIPEEPLSGTTRRSSDSLPPLLASRVSDYLFESLEQERGHPLPESILSSPPVPADDEIHDSSTGLTQSLETSMRSRQRRSMAYTPEMSPHAMFPTSSNAPASSHPPAPDTFPNAPQWRFSETDLLQITHPPSPPSPASPYIPAVSSQSPALISFSTPSSGQPSPSLSDTGPRHGHRSTVSYLQVERPRTMLFEDTIVLRKGENGVYHILDQ